MYKRKRTTSLPSIKKRTKYQGRKPSYSNKVTILRPRLTERKWRQVGYIPVTPLCGQLVAINPFYYMTNTANQDGKIGLNLSNVNLYFQGKYTHWGTSSAGSPKFESSNCRILVLASPNEWNQGAAENTFAPLTGGVGNNLLTTDIMMDSGIDRVTHSFINKDTVKVLYDSGPLRAESSGIPNNNTNGFTRNIKFNCKIGDIRFKYNGASYCRDDNVYVVMCCDAFGFQGPVANDVIGTFGVNMMITYNDM